MDGRRGGSRSRGYSVRWEKAATTFKARHPQCLGCQAVGEFSATAVVDHVVPHKGDQARFWDTAMWQPACRHCHDVVKKMIERMFEVGEVPVADLWLSSATAVDLRRKHRPIRAVGIDGW